MAPEPVLTGGGALGPLETAEQRESVSMALLLLPSGPATGGLVHATAGIRHAGLELSTAEVNGSAAVLAWSGGILFGVIIPEIGPDGITALYTIANPDKLEFTAR